MFARYCCPKILILIALASLVLTSCVGSPSSEVRDTKAPSESTGPKRILALGDSLTAGYGLSVDESYPSQLEQKLTTNGYSYRVENAGVSGDTSAQLLDRIEWAIGTDPVAVAIVAIGANDAFQSKNPEDIKKNITQILDVLESKNIPVLLSGMKAPLNLGLAYVSSFEGIYADLKKHPSVEGYIPFLLEGVALRPELNLPDRIHPTKEGYTIVTETVYDALEKNNLIKK